MFADRLMKVLYRTLENPQIFNIVVKVFSIGGRGKALQEFISKLIATEATQTVLELGCGTGQFLEHFIVSANFYVAIDINLDYLFHCSRIDNQPHFVLCSSVSLPFRSHIFDTVCPIHVSPPLKRRSFEHSLGN